jgi:hypothetical protein
MEAQAAALRNVVERQGGEVAALRAAAAAAEAQSTAAKVELAQVRGDGCLVAMCMQGAYAGVQVLQELQSISRHADTASSHALDRMCTCVTMQCIPQVCAHIIHALEPAATTLMYPSCSAFSATAPGSALHTL